MKCIEIGKYREHIRDEINDLKEVAPTSTDIRGREKIMRAAQSVRSKVAGALYVVQEEKPTNMLAAVETKTRKMLITQATLESSSQSDLNHIIEHEKSHLVHLAVGIHDVNFKDILTEEERETLQTSLNIDLEKIDWLEGINEYHTQQKLGRILENCAYNTHDVPAAKKLEQLTKKHTGKSLIEAMYESKFTFIQILKLLCKELKKENIQSKAA